MIKNALLLINLLFLLSCAVNPVTGNQDFVLISENQEINMGKGYAREVLKQEKIYKNNLLQNYVQDLGEELAKNSHRPNLIYRFTVLDNPGVNAFALPGGHIFIYRGLLAHFNKEEELAAVLAHEIGHVTARHSVKQYSQNQAAQILTTVIGQEYGRTAGDLSYLMGGALISGYGRDMELQADGLAVQYTTKLGYSENGMLSTLGVLKDHQEYSKEVSKRRGISQQTYHGVFSSHPTNDKRLKEIINSSVQISKKTKTNDRLFSFIDGLIYGDSSEEGIKRGDSFYHKELGIFLSAPKKWEMINNPNSLVFLSPKGDAFIEVTIDDQLRVEKPRDFLKRLTNNKFTEDKSLTIGKYRASIGKAKLNGEDLFIAAIFRKKQIFIFSSAVNTENKTISEFKEEFDLVIRSFRDLEKRELSLAEPLRLKIYKVRKYDTYKSLAKKSPISFDAELNLRLLNGDYPKGSLKTGRLIKIVY